MRCVVSVYHIKTTCVSFLFFIPIKNHLFYGYCLYLIHSSVIKLKLVNVSRRKEVSLKVLLKCCFVSTKICFQSLLFVESILISW
uniref:Ovule protein n=1 Tax=Heterorhabditis bacteriophora TaxID=37862 RepID=A0A1I7WZZ7_HETBA